MASKLKFEEMVKILFSRVANTYEATWWNFYLDFFKKQTELLQQQR
jgi:hypothetical protein